MCLLSQPVGNAGGNSYLYMVDDSKPKDKEYQCAAMRGRYNSDGKIAQQLELGSSDHANALTTVQKDCLVVEKRKEL